MSIYPLPQFWNEYLEIVRGDNLTIVVRASCQVEPEAGVADHLFGADPERLHYHRWSDDHSED